MQELPTGLQSFECIRKNNYLYIDKTEKILQLAKTDKSYFLSRPRRFGKSLTISTLEAMFKGKTELFKGLYAEEWVKEQAKNPNPVIRLDMSALGNYEDKKELNKSIINYLVRYYIKKYKLDIVLQDSSSDVFLDVINELYEKFGSVVVLIDEYDKPMTDNIDNLEKANEMRELLRKFYNVLKGRDEVKFVMFTGVSKFSKAGVFSGLNNLKDISMTEKYGDIVGYTQKELEDNFGDYLEITSKELKTDKDNLLTKIKKHYDGFSFDGITRVYNPFSILNFFEDKKFRNYWYDSCTPSFLAKYFKEHKINDSDEYRHLKVSSNFTNASEIEHASPESFLFQTGYLTIEKWDDDKDEITLDFPNKEVKDSLPNLYLYNIYNITDYIKLADEILVSLKNGDMLNVMLIFNGILARIPKDIFAPSCEGEKKLDDFSNDSVNKKTIESLNEEQRKIFENLMYSKKEKWYRSLFIMLLSAVKVEFYPEVHDFQGRSDVVIPFEDKIIIIEFKLAPTSKDVSVKKKEGEEQIKKYVPAYEDISSFINEGEKKLSNKKVITAVFVADDQKRQVIL